MDFSALLSLVWATADWLSEVTLKLYRPIPSNNTKQSVCISNSVHTYWSLFAAVHWCRLWMSIWAGIIMGYCSNGNCALRTSPFFFMETKCQLFTKKKNKVSKAVKNTIFGEMPSQGRMSTSDKNKKYLYNELTNAQFINNLLYCCLLHCPYMFRCYFIIFRELVVSTC